MAQPYSVNDHSKLCIGWSRNPQGWLVAQHQIRLSNQKPTHRKSGADLRQTISSPKDLDEELKTWLEAAYVLPE